MIRNASTQPALLHSPGREIGSFRSDDLSSKSFSDEIAKAEQILKNSNYLVPSPQSTKDFCINHATRLASYHSKLDSSKMCTKCAFIYEMVNFADNEKLLSSEELVKKRTINNFYKQLLNFHKQFSKNDVKLSKRARSIELRTQKSINFLNQMERDLTEATKDFFSKMRMKVSAKGGSSQTDVMTKKSLITKKQDVIVKFIKDIEDNYEKILFSIDLEPFEEIILNYEQKLADLKLYLSKVRPKQSEDETQYSIASNLKEAFLENLEAIFRSSSSKQLVGSLIDDAKDKDSKKSRHQQIVKSPSSSHNGILKPHVKDLRESMSKDKIKTNKGSKSKDIFVAIPKETQQMIVDKLNDRGVKTKTSQRSVNCTIDDLRKKIESLQRHKNKSLRNLVSKHETIPSELTVNKSHLQPNETSKIHEMLKEIDENDITGDFKNFGPASLSKKLETLAVKTDKLKGSISNGGGSDPGTNAHSFKKSLKLDLSKKEEITSKPFTFVKQAFDSSSSVKSEDDHESPFNNRDFSHLNANPLATNDSQSNNLNQNQSSHSSVRQMNNHNLTFRKMENSDCSSKPMTKQAKNESQATHSEKEKPYEFDDFQMFQVSSNRHHNSSKNVLEINRADKILPENDSNTINLSEYTNIRKSCPDDNFLDKALGQSSPHRFHTETSSGLSNRKIISKVSLGEIETHPRKEELLKHFKGPIETTEICESQVIDENAQQTPNFNHQEKSASHYPQMHLKKQASPLSEKFDEIMSKLSQPNETSKMETNGDNLLKKASLSSPLNSEADSHRVVDRILNKKIEAQTTKQVVSGNEREHLKVDRLFQKKGLELKKKSKEFSSQMLNTIADDIKIRKDADKIVQVIADFVAKDVGKADGKLYDSTPSTSNFGVPSRFVPSTNYLLAMQNSEKTSFVKTKRAPIQQKSNNEVSSMSKTQAIYSLNLKQIPKALVQAKPKIAPIKIDYKTACDKRSALLKSESEREQASSKRRTLPVTSSGVGFDPKSLPLPSLGSSKKGFAIANRTALARKL